MNPAIVSLLASPMAMLAYSALLYLGLCAVAARIVRLDEPRRSTSPASGRIGALDGLRGVLAIVVFIHHHAIWYVFQHTGTWRDSRNPIVIHFGQTAVAMFFMLTGFLFTRKTQSPHFAWGDFFRGRAARIAPLFVVVVAIAFGCIAVASNGELREDPVRILQEFAKWLTFEVPDVNGYRQSFTVIASVSWSLQYEVLFYVMGVPALFAINRLVSKPVALACAVGSIGILLVLHRGLWLRYGETLFALHFLAGVAVAYVVSMPSLARHVRTRAARWVGAAAACALACTADGRQIEAYLATLIVFAAVAGGASVFGLLRTRPAIWLGDISFGVYLLHGIVLWVTYRATGGPTTLAGFLVFSAAIGAAIVLLASASYLRLEMPMMRRFHARRTRRPADRASSPFEGARMG